MVNDKSDVTDAPEQVRTTRANVQHCCEDSYEALLHLLRSLPIPKSKRRGDISGGGGPTNEARVAGVVSHGAWTGVICELRDTHVYVHAQS